MENSSAGVKRILVVEDESGIRQVCQRVLTSQGYQVDFAPNGAIAEDMLMKENYDLLLVDIKTPVRNGKEFYQNIKDIKDKYSKLLSRVIFTTGDVISDDTQSFLKQAGRPFLLKPFTPDELRAIVRESLNR